MKRSSIVKSIGLIASLIIIVYAALLFGARSGLLPQLLHNLASDKYAAYSFSSYEDGRFYKAHILISAGGEVSEGDIGDKLKFCPIQSNWICLESDMIKFAIPRRTLNVGDHWKFSHVDYALLPSYKEMTPGGPVPNTDAPIWPYRILGRRYDLYVIKADHHDSREWSQIFLFSPVHGLIGYMYLGDKSSKHDERNATFWLTDENGPGSIDFDRGITRSAYMSTDGVEQLQK